jgi:energy-coupling factor transporter transmembrane protein EcfT
MYHSYGREETPKGGSKPLDQEVWRAWQEKNRLQDIRNAVTRMKAVKWLCVAVLIVTAVLFSHLSPYHAVVRFAVALGALVVMMQGFHTRRYIFAVLFAALVLLYNPFVPAFTFSGNWQRLFVLASLLPFLASLVWMNALSRAASMRRSPTTSP